MDQEKTDDLLDVHNTTTRAKKLWTIRFLIIGTLIIVATFVAATFWEAMGLTTYETIWLALTMILAFLVNITGFIVGFLERKKNSKRAIFGIIGNGLLVLFFLMIVVYSLFSVQPTQVN